MAPLKKYKFTRRLLKKLQIKNALTLPATVLQILIEEGVTSKTALKDALKCIEEIKELLEEL